MLIRHRRYLKINLADPLSKKDSHLTEPLLLTMYDGQLHNDFEDYFKTKNHEKNLGYKRKKTSNHLFHLEKFGVISRKLDKNGRIAFVESIFFYYYTDDSPPYDIIRFEMIMRTNIYTYIAVLYLQLHYWCTSSVVFRLVT